MENLQVENIGNVQFNSFSDKSDRHSFQSHQQNREQQRQDEERLKVRQINFEQELAQQNFKKTQNSGWQVYEFINFYLAKFRTSQQQQVYDDAVKMHQGFSPYFQYKPGDLPDHRCQHNDLLDRYCTSKQSGLDQSQADRLLNLYGKNEIQLSQYMNQLIQLLWHVLNPVTIILVLASIVYFVDYEDDEFIIYLWYALILLFSGFFTAVMNQIQVNKVKSLHFAFQLITPEKCKVKRNGYWTTDIDPKSLIPGDIVEIKKGDIIPADIVLLKSSNLKVCNQELNGNKSIKVRTNIPVSDKDRDRGNILHAQNVCFFCSTCIYGIGEGVVVRTGLNTAIGHVMQLTDACSKPETMINLVLKKFSRILITIIFISSLVELIITAAKGNDIKFSTKNWAGIIMSTTPLYGFIAISMCILISAKKMRDLGAAVSNLESVNTMGTTDVVLMEKSGTITFDYLVVRELNYNGKSITAEVNYDSYKTKLAKYEKYQIKIPKSRTPTSRVKLDHINMKDQGIIRGKKQKYMKPPKKPDYLNDIESNDLDLRALLDACVLTTDAHFRFEPTIDEIIKEVAEDDDKDPRYYPKNFDNQLLIKFPSLHQTYTQKREQLIKDEQKMSYNWRKVMGDLGEVGFAKFLEPIYLELTQEDEAEDQFEGGSDDDSRDQEDDNRGGMDKLREMYPIVNVGKLNTPCQVHYDADHHFVLHIRDMNPSKQDGDLEADDGYQIFIRGTPQRILDLCSFELSNGQRVEIDKDRIEKDIARLEKRGDKCFGLARLQLDPNQFQKPYNFRVNLYQRWEKVNQQNIQEDYNDKTPPGWFPMENYIFLGLVSEFDPPKNSSKKAVLQLKKAGMKVILITGDDLKLTTDLVRQMGIVKEQPLIRKKIWDLEAVKLAKAIILDGHDLSHLDKNENKDEILKTWLSVEEIVICRAQFYHKFQVILALQNLHQKVMQIGDGINDLPALKLSNTGIAMGSGSDMAKYVSDITLTKDNLSLVKQGVIIGQTLQANIAKTIYYLLSSILTKIIFALVEVIFSIPQPLTPLMHISDNILMLIMNCTSIAYAVPEKRKPAGLYSRRSWIFWFINMGLFNTFAVYFAFFTVANDYGISPAVMYGINEREGWYPQASDTFNITLPDFGNSEYRLSFDALLTEVVIPERPTVLLNMTTGEQLLFYGNQAVNMSYFGYRTSKLDWVSMFDAKVDVRLFYANLPIESWSECRFGQLQNRDENQESYRSYSQMTNQQICYTTEALKYAQTASFVTLSFLQIAIMIAVKLYDTPVFQFLLRQKNVMLLIFQICIIVILVYMGFFHFLLGTRNISVDHFVGVWPLWFILIIVQTEIRKNFLKQRGFLPKSLQSKDTSDDEAEQVQGDPHDEQNDNQDYRSRDQDSHGSSGSGGDSKSENENQI